MSHPATKQRALEKLNAMSPVVISAPKSASNRMTSSELDVFYAGLDDMDKLTFVSNKLSLMEFWTGRLMQKLGRPAEFLTEKDFDFDDTLVRIACVARRPSSSIPRQSMSR